MAGTRTLGRRVCRSVARSASGITLDSSGPARLSGRRARLVVATALLLAITASAMTVYVAGPGVVTAAWLAVGPLLGGYLISAASWRWIFFLNVPVAVVVLFVAVRHVPVPSLQTGSAPASVMSPPQDQHPRLVNR